MTHVRFFCVVCCLAWGLAWPRPAAAEVNVGIQIGVPPPPPILVEPPPFVVVPATPAVRYAPAAPIDVFFYGDRYYAWNGGWFVSASFGQPWVYVETARVPRPVRIVPARYYKIPPGHAKRLYGGPHGPYHGRPDWYVDPDGHGQKHKHKHD